LVKLVPQRVGTLCCACNHGGSKCSMPYTPHGVLQQSCSSAAA
jgi:hypothetical protein